MREYRDVVTLIGFRRLLRAGSMFAAGPQSVDRAGRRIREDARAVDDFRVLRRRERHLDHVDAEERRVRIFTGLESRTAGELFRRSDQAGPRAVHIEIARILRIGHERMRVRSAARLNRRDLARLAEIADVENADAAEPFGADLVLNTLRAAVDAAARLLDRHEQQVAVHRHVALPAGTHRRREQLRLPGDLDVVGVEAVEVAHEEVRAAEREVGVGESEHIREPRVGRFVRIWRRQVGIAFGRRRRAAGRLRIEKSFGLGQRGDALHVLRGLAGIAQSGLEADARIGGGRRPAALLRAARDADTHEQKRHVQKDVSNRSHR